MTNLSTPVIREAVTAMDTTGAHFVVDVGGADGAFIAALLQHNPALTGAVLDLAQVIPGVIEAAAAHGLQSRMTGIVGDFFDEVPAADVYLLKFVLHDWDDESCVRILSNIRAAMKPGARLFIVEMAITAHHLHQRNPDGPGNAGRLHGAGTRAIRTSRTCSSRPASRSAEPSSCIARTI